MKFLLLALILMWPAFVLSVWLAPVTFAGWLLIGLPIQILGMGILINQEDLS